MEGEEAPHDVKWAITLSGVALNRRCACTDASPETDMWTTTCALLLAILILATEDLPRPVGSEEDGLPVEALAAWTAETLSASLASVETDTNSWTAALREPSAVASHVLQHATRNRCKLGMVQLKEMAAVFFRASSDALALSVLDASGVSEGGDFLSLTAASFLMEVNESDREEKLTSIAAVAESEAGQSVTCF
jgi:hypothetical protein